MDDDIVERLRSSTQIVLPDLTVGPCVDECGDCGFDPKLAYEAADEIERLQSKIAALEYDLVYGE